MIDPARADELACARQYVWRKWLPRVAPKDFERLIAGFRADLAARDAALASANHLVNDLWTQHLALQDVIKGERARARTLARENRRLRRANAAALAALEATQAHARRLEQALAQTRDSTSWRLTAPLRRAVGLVRGGPAP
jgi:hypothetical protein